MKLHFANPFEMRKPSLFKVSMKNILLLMKMKLKALC